MKKLSAAEQHEVNANKILANRKPQTKNFSNAPHSTPTDQSTKDITPEEKNQKEVIQDLSKLNKPDLQVECIKREIPFVDADTKKVLIKKIKGE